MNLSALSKLSGRAIRQSVRGKVKYFTYTSAPLTVPAISGANFGTNSTRINIDGDSHFIVCHLTGSYLFNSLRTLPQLHGEPEVQIQEEGSGYLLFDRALRWRHVIGSGMQPFEITPPYLFRSRSTALVTFNNPETVAYTVSVSMIGYKLYLR